MLNPNQIRSQEFDVSVLGGYKRESVDSFFAQVADDYERLVTENSELVKKLKVCVSKIEEYRKDEEFLKSAIINAEKLNENTLRNIEERERQSEKSAKETADRIISEAKAEAEGIIAKAKLDMEKSIQSREAEAAVKIEEIRRSVQKEEQALRHIKKEVSDFKERLLKLYKLHLNSINTLPSEKPEPAEEKKPPVSPPEKRPEPEIKPEPSVFPSAEPEKEEPVPVHVGGEKTAEFVIDTKPEPEKSADAPEPNLKFQGLKFGTDFDLNKDE